MSNRSNHAEKLLVYFKMFWRLLENGKDLLNNNAIKSAIMILLISLIGYYAFSIDQRVSRIEKIDLINPSSYFSGGVDTFAGAGAGGVDTGAGGVDTGAGGAGAGGAAEGAGGGGTAGAVAGAGGEGVDTGAGGAGAALDNEQPGSDVEALASEQELEDFFKKLSEEEELEVKPAKKPRKSRKKVSD